MKIITDLNRMGILKTTKVLIVFPHPDDETAFSAGLLQKLKQNGNIFNLIVLTSGEASTLVGGLKSGQKLNEVRKTELAQAMSILGVSSYKVFDFPDGKLSETTELKHFLKREIVDFKPNIVITFEPSGVYGHPDHIFLSKAVTNLHDETKTFKICYATVSPTHCTSKDSLRMAQYPKEVIPIKPDYALLLSPREISKKYKAMQMHKSQFSSPSVLDIFRWIINGLWAFEFYSVK